MDAEDRRLADLQVEVAGAVLAHRRQQFVDLVGHARMLTATAGATTALDERFPDPGATVP
ncbi:hypothetical protein LBMAG53_00950 [Planctomycetota bacterium]|nr:hypothetical protein LBMAG53_00950 [Planctomycetota bacterium]